MKLCITGAVSNHEWGIQWMCSLRTRPTTLFQHRTLYETVVKGVRELEGDALASHWCTVPSMTCVLFSVLDLPDC